MDAVSQVKKQQTPITTQIVTGARNLQEALVGVEPTMADLQSAALATWLQRQTTSSLQLREPETTGQVGAFRPLSGRKLHGLYRRQRQ